MLVTGIYVYIVLGGIFMAVSFLGNALIITYFGFVTEQKNGYQFYILTLAVVETLSSISVMIFDFPNRINPEVWYFGKTSCIYGWPFGVSLATSSVHILVLMSYDRYQRITNPMKYSTSNRKIIITVLAIVFLNCLILVPLFTNMEYKDNRCYFYHVDRIFKEALTFRIYPLIAVCFLRFILPLVLMCYFYNRIKKDMEKRAMNLSSKAIKYRNKCILKTIFWLTLVFTISVGSYQSFMLLEAVLAITSNPWMNTDSYLTTYFCLYGFMYVNYAANCFIYAGTIPSFQRFLRKHFLCKRLKNDGVDTSDDLTLRTI